MAAEWSEWSRDIVPLQGRDSSWPAILRALGWLMLASWGRGGEPRSGGTVHVVTSVGTRQLGGHG